MTTIVYRDGVLAADRRSSDGSYILPGRYRKAYKNKTGWLYAAAGTSGPCEDLNRFMHRAPADMDMFQSKFPRGDYSALIVSPQGELYVVERGLVEEITKVASFYALGSGSGPALGALYMGASAVDAVEIAQQIDMKSGGGTDHVTLS